VLRIDDLSAGYGEATVLRGVSLTVEPGEVVTLCGRNGAGKTTLLRSVMGLHTQYSGEIALAGASLAGRAPHQRARAGLGWVPDDRGSYATLSVSETLALPPVVKRAAAWSLERIFETFPNLYQRRNSAATKLSGGEQQMLAIARVLRMGATMLLCDEPTEGLSPLLVQQVGAVLREVKQHGVTVLLVEQNLHFATTVADRHYLLAEGRIAESLANDEVRDRERELLAYLGI
jgi:branched-chain amino acid transport system ATP-binding protein